MKTKFALDLKPGDVVLHDGGAITVEKVEIEGSYVTLTDADGLLWDFRVDDESVPITTLGREP